MTPDILTQIRVLLTAVGGYLVGKGHVNEAIMEALVGLVLVLIPAVWAWWSNRPQSREAVQIAEKVAESDSPAAAHIAVAGTLEPGQVERRNQ